MNEEIIKAMNKKQKKISAIGRWWRKNGHIICRILLFPAWFFIVAKEKINKRLNERTAWSEERTKEILNYYIPRRCHWHPENKTLSFFDNGEGWHMYFAKHILKRKDRRYWKKYGSHWTGDIRKYLINKFELDGFTKEIEDGPVEWTTITFRLKNEN